MYKLEIDRLIEDFHLVKVFFGKKKIITMNVAMTAKAKQPPDRSFSKFFTPSELKHHAKTIKLSVLHWQGTNYIVLYIRENQSTMIFFFSI